MESIIIINYVIKLVAKGKDKAKLLTVDALTNSDMSEEVKNGSLNGLQNISESYSTAGKRPKILSAIGSVSSKTVRDNGGRERDGEYEAEGDNNFTSGVEDRNKQNLRPDGSSRPDVVQRNKRMFGSLMGIYMCIYIKVYVYSYIFMYTYIDTYAFLCI
jgi:hypothetical protein